jgi:hypothetical protein
MKTLEYIEGPKALKNFEDGMRTIFQASKPVKRGKKKATPSRYSRKRDNADGDVKLLV